MTPPIDLLAGGRYAEGNRLGAPAALWARIAVTGTLPDEAAMCRWLERLDPVVASEYAATPAPGPADGAAMLARVMAATMLVGRDLAIAIERDAGGALVVVELGRAAAPDGVAALAAQLVAAAAADAPAAALRPRLAAVGAPEIKAFLRFANNLVPQRLARRGLPFRAALGREGLLIGEGAGARWLRFTLGLGTGMLAASIAGRKDAASALLARFGLPVPRQLPAREIEAAVGAASRIGYPVVVKPVDRSGGAGVAAGLTDPGQVRAAFRRAAAVSRNIVVEAMLPGEDHRLTVIGGSLVAAAHRIPAEVTGDGRSSVDALVDRVNADPERTGSRCILLPIARDGEAERVLAAQGLSFGSVPEAGRKVRLHSVANLSMGARPVDVTARVHPDNRAAACQAADLLGLDMAGVDFISPDITRSWREVGGGICEVNREPGLLVHHIAAGSPDMAEACIVHLLADGPPPLIPIVAVLGGEPASAAARRIAAAMAAAGLAVGLATGRGLVAGGLALRDPGRGDPMRVARVLADPTVQAAVVAVRPETILDRGFGHPRADVALLVEPDAPGAAAAGAILRGLGAELVVTADPPDEALVRALAARRPAGS